MTEFRAGNLSVTQCAQAVHRAYSTGLHTLAGRSRVEKCDRSIRSLSKNEILTGARMDGHVPRIAASVQMTQLHYGSAAMVKEIN